MSLAAWWGVVGVGWAGLGKSLITCGALGVMLMAHRPEVGGIKAPVGSVLDRHHVIDIGGRSRAALHGAIGMGKQMLAPKHLPVVIVPASGRRRSCGQPFTVTSSSSPCRGISAGGSMERRARGHDRWPHVRATPNLGAARRCAE